MEAVVIGDISTPEGREKFIAEAVAQYEGLSPEDSDKVAAELREVLEKAGTKEAREKLAMESAQRMLLKMSSRIDQIKSSLLGLAQTHRTGPRVYEFGTMDGMLLIASGATHTVANMIGERLAKMAEPEQPEAEPEGN